MDARARMGQVLVVVVVIAMVGLLAQAKPDTPSIDKVSTSPNDPTALLDIGMGIQAPKAQLDLGANDDNVDTLEVQVPEPAVLILLVGGAVPILLGHRRKMRA